MSILHQGTSPSLAKLSSVSSSVFFFFFLSAFVGLFVLLLINKGSIPKLEGLFLARLGANHVFCHGGGLGTDDWGGSYLLVAVISHGRNANAPSSRIRRRRYYFDDTRKPPPSVNPTLRPSTPVSVALNGPPFGTSIVSGINIKCHQNTIHQALDRHHPAPLRRQGACTHDKAGEMTGHGLRGSPKISRNRPPPPSRSHALWAKRDDAPEMNPCPPNFIPATGIPSSPRFCGLPWGNQ